MLQCGSHTFVPVMGKLFNSISTSTVMKISKKRSKTFMHSHLMPIFFLTFYYLLHGYICEIHDILKICMHVNIIIFITAGNWARVTSLLVTISIRLQDLFYFVNRNGCKKLDKLFGDLENDHGVMYLQEAGIPGIHILQRSLSKCDMADDR